MVDVTFSDYKVWFKTHLKLIGGLAAYVIVLYILLLLNLLPVYAEKPSDAKSVYFFPIVFIIGLLVYAYFDIAQNEIEEEREKPKAE
ncbi:hypothetical protein TVAG_324530 [Trichomonas vaginalis G3]|uniref:Uncharacterized protein n=1 Tax=Trichomonas vaginalis (strain ATCC PRA-98 / G3) TaxID=412133 RepID=A2FFQ4_TRIV3|nr:hypothetical protein TVAGG3_0489580 [Trichomonas vaginalis G3]EAX96279.1 hypothetical protein TVAG_324530 [Trichomonas vaginalis G3]KAI5516282.1 hypothetical protein TVAGG3_0489580 [Trichomonas vaginalis G3]|eukprot:XP_001309209.1 hypothetical protein [Trichomonas vaginalis G3]